MSTNSVTHPSHYNSGQIEVIEAIEDWKLNFHRGNAVKYTARAGKKDPTKEIEDLQKACWYIQREIEVLTALATARAPTRPNDMNPKPTTMEGLKYSSVTDVSNLKLPENLIPTAENVLNHFLRGRRWQSVQGRWDYNKEKGFLTFIPTLRFYGFEELLDTEEDVFVMMGI